MECPEFKNAGRNADGYWRTCHFGHDHETERKLLLGNMKIHADYYCWVKAVDMEEEKKQAKRFLDSI